MLKEDMNGLLTKKCRKCGCIKIVNANTFRTSYKPAGFTLNPLNTLTEEPPCPATW